MKEGSSTQTSMGSASSVSHCTATMRFLSKATGSAHSGCASSDHGTVTCCQLVPTETWARYDPQQGFASGRQSQFSAVCAVCTPTSKCAGEAARAQNWMPAYELLDTS